MSVRLRFRMPDASAPGGSKQFSVNSSMEMELLRSEPDWQEERLALLGAVYQDEDREMESGIHEQWNTDILCSYMKNIEELGAPYFFFCEAIGSRHPEGFACPEEFMSFADAGNAIAERYFDVPEGGLKYIRATKLARDIMNGEGPGGLPQGLIIFAEPLGDPVYLIDPANRPAPETGINMGMGRC